MTLRHAIENARSRARRSALLLYVLTAGCTTSRAEPLDAQPPQLVDAGPPADANELVLDAAPPASASVRPGINQPYFAEGALERFTGVLEAESREVVKQRGAIVAALRLAPGSQVADIGAGTGLFTLPLARRVGSAGRVHAVDIVPAFLARIAARAAQAKLDNVRTVLGDERGVVLPAQSLDLAFLCDVYHHLEYPDAYLASLQRALKPGGKLVVIDFKRVPGVTKPALLEHVRAGQEVVTREIERAGFRLLEARRGLLRENYFLVFTRP